MQETGAQSLGWEDPLEKEMATHFSFLARRIPWIEEPVGLQSMGSQKKKKTNHDLSTKQLTAIRHMTQEFRTKV